MEDPDIGSLMKAASERRLAVEVLQEKYRKSVSIPSIIDAASVGNCAE